MDNIIEFSARGHAFSLSKELLKRYPQSLLYMLSEQKDVPIDMIDDTIYVDINPFSINCIVDYHNIHDYNIDDFYTLMDFRYIGLDDFRDIELEPKKPVKLTEKTNDIMDIDVSKPYKVHTSDSKTLQIYLGSLDRNNLNAISKMMHIIKNDTNHIYAWTSMTERMFNILLSIMRDGISDYYNFLTSGEFYSQSQNNDDALETYQENIVFNECSSVDETDPYGTIYSYSECELGCGCKKDRKSKVCPYVCECHEKYTKYGMYEIQQKCKNRKKISRTESDVRINEYNDNCDDCPDIRKNAIDELTRDESLFALDSYIHDYIYGCSFHRNSENGKIAEVHINFNRDIINIVKNIAIKLDNDKKMYERHIKELYQLIEKFADKKENKKILKYLQLYFNIG